MAVTVDGVTESRRAAVVLALQSVLRMAPDDLFRQLGGVVFRHALQKRFQDDALWSVGNILGGGEDLDVVFFELRFVPGAVVTVPGKSVQLPDQDHIKQTLGAVLYHPLEIRTVVSLGGQGPVNVGADNSDLIFLAIGGTLPQLALNAFLPLIVAGVTGVNYCFHFSFSASSSIFVSTSFSRSLIGEAGSKHISTNSFKSELPCSIRGRCS